MAHDTPAGGLQELICIVDENSNGILEFPEFHNMLVLMVLQKAFEAADQDGSGSIR